MLVLVLGLVGCGTRGFFGVGDGKVSDTEAGLLDLAGYSAGQKAQRVLGAPPKGRQYRLVGEATSFWDSVGTVVHPPIHFRVDPDFASMTGTYGAVQSPQALEIDPAVIAQVAAMLGRPVQGPGLVITNFITRVITNTVLVETSNTVAEASTNARPPVVVTPGAEALP